MSESKFHRIVAGDGSPAEIALASLLTTDLLTTRRTFVSV